MTWDPKYEERKAKCLAALAGCDTGDTERDHVMADKALLDMIDDPEIRTAFEALERWYA